MIHKKGVYYSHSQRKGFRRPKSADRFRLEKYRATSTVNITGAGKTATAAPYMLRLSTTKVFIYTSLLFKQNRSVTQGGFCYIAKPTVNIVNFTQTPYKISQQNYKKVFKKAKV